MDELRDNCHGLNVAGGGKGKIQLDEFKVYTRQKLGYSGEEIDQLFKAMDLNNNEIISEDECALNLDDLKRMVDGLGSPDIIMSTMDANEDGKLDDDEFDRIGDMLYMKGNELMGTKRTRSYFYRLDKSRDGFLSKDELHFDLPPTATPTAAPTKKATTTSTPPTTTTTGSVVVVNADEGGDTVTLGMLSAYRNIAAKITGNANLELHVPNDATFPTDAGEAVWPIFKVDFEKAFGTAELTFVEAGSLPTSEAALADHNDGASFSVKEAFLSFSFDSADGGGFQQALSNHVEEFKQSFLARLKASDKPWLTATVDAYLIVKITCEYNGAGSDSLPEGTSIAQHFGWSHDTKLIDSSPFAEESSLEAQPALSRRLRLDSGIVI